MKTFVVIGLGRFGKEIATKLFSLGNEVLAIDEDDDSIREIADSVTYAVVGDARNIEVLRNLGVNNYDTAIVAVGSDLSAGILITMNLKELKVKNVICKAGNEQYKAALEKVGADRVIIPEQTMAVKLAENLSSNSVLDFIALSDDYSIAEATIPISWTGKSIAELNVRAKYDVVLLAIKRDNEMIVSPKPDMVFCAEDIVLALGENTALDRIK